MNETKTKNSNIILFTQKIICKEVILKIEFRPKIGSHKYTYNCILHFDIPGYRSDRRRPSNRIFLCIYLPDIRSGRLLPICRL